MALQNFVDKVAPFVDKVAPAVSAAFLNGLDVTVNEVLAGAQSVPEAQAALGLSGIVDIDIPVPINQGGTGAETATEALVNLGGTTLSQVLNTFYPQTPAEIAADVTPTNLQYPPGNVFRYGAVGNGTTDDTQALQTAITVAGALAGGGIAYLTSNAFLVSSALVIAGSNVSLKGAGNSSVIVSNSATADVIQITGSHIDLSDFVINASVARTAGLFINVGGTGVANVQVEFIRIRRVHGNNWFNGIGYLGVGGTTLRIEDGNWSTNVPGGIGVNINTSPLASADMVLKDLLIEGPSSSSQGAIAIQVLSAGDLTLDHVSTVHMGVGLNVVPGNGQVVEALFCHDSFFDTGNGTGVNFNPAAGGTIQLARFGRVWSASNTNGFILGASGTGLIQDAEFVDCIGSNNTNDGFVIDSPICTDVRVIGGSFSANGETGVTIVSGVTKFKILGAIIGPCGEFAGNTVGLSLDGLNDLFTISDCDITNNTTASVITAPTGGVPGQTWFITNNQGIVTNNGQTGVALESAATTTTINHGLSGTPDASDIMLTPNSGNGTAGQLWINGATSTHFVINSTAVPGAGVLVAWRARIWGT